MPNKFGWLQAPATTYQSRQPKITQISELPGRIANYFGTLSFWNGSVAVRAHINHVWNRRCTVELNQYPCELPDRKDRDDDLKLQNFIALIIQLL